MNETFISKCSETGVGAQTFPRIQIISGKITIRYGQAFPVIVMRATGHLETVASVGLCLFLASCFVLPSSAVFDSIIDRGQISLSLPPQLHSKAGKVRKCAGDC